MIKGTLEIYKHLDESKELVYQDNNLIVDGAGKTLVDMLTTNPSLSATHASGVFDASNYAIQAISFGKAAEAYNKNAHIFSATVGHYNRHKHPEFGTGPIDADAGSALAVIAVSPSGDRDPYYRGGPNHSAFFEHYTSTLTTPSSYVATPHLPKAPSPLDTKLEEGVALSGNTGDVYLSSYGTGIGQNLNFLAYADYLTRDLSGGVLSAIIGSPIGCFAPAVSADTNNRAGVPFYILSSYDQLSDASGSIDPIMDSPSGTYGSLFNHVSSMDTSGFVRAYYPSGYGYDPFHQVEGSYEGGGGSESDQSSPLSGLIVSSTPNFSSVGQVYCTMTISGHDLGMANLYGGITTLGLWVPDIPKCLEDGQVPPLKFHPINNQFRYRLFAKKVLLENMCTISDNMSIVGTVDANAPGCTNYSNLTLVWKLRFL